MKSVIIIGAGGNIAKHVIDILVKNNDINLTLFLREANRLAPALTNAIFDLTGKRIRKLPFDLTLV